MILVFAKSCYTSEEKLYFLPPYPYDGYHFTLPKNEPVCTRQEVCALDWDRRRIVWLRVEDLFEIPLKGWNRKGKRVKKNIKGRERGHTMSGPPYELLSLRLFSKWV